MADKQIKPASRPDLEAIRRELQSFPARDNLDDRQKAAAMLAYIERLEGFVEKAEHPHWCAVEKQLPCNCGWFDLLQEIRRGREQV